MNVDGSGQRTTLIMGPWDRARQLLLMGASGVEVKGAGYILVTDVGPASRLPSSHSCRQASAGFQGRREAGIWSTREEVCQWASLRSEGRGGSRASSSLMAA